MQTARPRKCQFAPLGNPGSSACWISSMWGRYTRPTSLSTHEFARGSGRPNPNVLVLSLRTGLTLGRCARGDLATRVPTVCCHHKPYSTIMIEHAPSSRKEAPHLRSGARARRHCSLARRIAMRREYCEQHMSYTYTYIDSVIEVKGMCLIKLVSVNLTRPPRRRRPRGPAAGASAASWRCSPAA